MTIKRQRKHILLPFNLCECAVFVEDESRAHDTHVLPLAEVVIYTLLWSKILGNHAPLTVCYEKIQNRIHDVSERMFSLSFLAD